MDILIQIPQLIYAGAEKVLVNFANYLIEKGHNVEILETYEKGYLKPLFKNDIVFNSICSKEYSKKYYCSLQDIKREKKLSNVIIGLSKLTFSKIVGYERFAKFLSAKHYKNKKYDVAINYLETESPEFLLKNISAKKYLQWCHIDIKNINNKKSIDVLLNYYKAMDAIICVSQSAKKSFIERYPELSDKTYVIYNFFDRNYIENLSKKPLLYNKDKTFLLSVGRMTPQKGYLRFLEILKQLKEEGHSFCWYILGDGFERKEIEQKICKYHLHDCVRLIGIDDNPYKYIKNCDLFILPSEYEGFPTVTVEAKILNKPVLATDVSGIKEQITHGKSGWIVENSQEEIYNGLKYLLSSPNILKKLSVNPEIEIICNNELKYNQFISILKGKY
ncbi:MAG: glycosyltransferase [Clostridia bacterium]|nr:glycosyltransferase [Clostridia bacterium]